MEPGPGLESYMDLKWKRIQTKLGAVLHLHTGLGPKDLTP